MAAASKRVLAFFSADHGSRRGKTEMLVVRIDLKGDMRMSSPNLRTLLGILTGSLVLPGDQSLDQIGGRARRIFPRR
jgi:hypothetical protein